MSRRSFISSMLAAAIAPGPRYKQKILKGLSAECLRKILEDFRQHRTPLYDKLIMKDIRLTDGWLKELDRTDLCP